MIIGLIGGGLDGLPEGKRYATLAQGKDLILSTASGVATHFTGSGDTDVAGSLSVTPAAGITSPGPAVGTAQYNFIEPYTTAPNVVVTASGNPTQSGQVPAVWVTLNVNSSNQYTGFILHYQVPSTTSTPATITYNYHVIGS